MDMDLVEGDNENDRPKERCIRMELEIQKCKSDYKVLEVKYRDLEAEKHVIEEELMVLKKINNELKERLSCIENDRRINCQNNMKVKSFVDLTEEDDEEDEVFQLMAENQVLEIEKEKAEREADTWKQKVGELESLVSQIKEKLVIAGDKELLERNGGIGYVEDVGGARASGATCNGPGKGVTAVQVTGTPLSATAYEHTFDSKREGEGTSLEIQGGRGKSARKRLTFDGERSPAKKMAPSTPGASKPVHVGVLNISDSDDESVNISDQIHTPNEKELAKPHVLTKPSVSGGMNGEKIDYGYKGSCKENLDLLEENVKFTFTPKKKQSCNIVSSDEDEDDDDDRPISYLKKKSMQDTSDRAGRSSLNQCNDIANNDTVNNLRNSLEAPGTRRRRIMTWRESESKGLAKMELPTEFNSAGMKDPREVFTAEDDDDDGSRDIESVSEGESLGGFIVDDSHWSEGDDTSSESKVVSDGSDFDEVLSRFKRNKDKKAGWEFEGDMLAAFGKDPILCMKAVCALYRQQTADEKISKGTFHVNGRGFSKLDAYRGSALGEFLTDGDPVGDLKKTAEELLEFDPKAVDACRKLASHYSKQLFEIYKNREDPFFLP